MKKSWLKSSRIEMVVAIAALVLMSSSHAFAVDSCTYTLAATSSVVDTSNHSNFSVATATGKAVKSAAKNMESTRFTAVEGEGWEGQPSPQYITHGVKITNRVCNSVRADIAAPAKERIAMVYAGTCVRTNGPAHTDPKISCNCTTGTCVQTLPAPKKFILRSAGATEIGISEFEN